MTDIITPFEKSILTATRYWEALRKKDPSARYQQSCKIFNSKNTTLIHVVSCVEILPANIFRRWLRWSNTDFQGFDLFLKRINAKQVKSLKEHAEAYLSNTKKEDLPCYKNGMRNLAWKVVEFFVKKPVVETAEKYQESSALKTDFAGIGFGFPMYPKMQAKEKKPEPSKLETFFRIFGLGFFADMVSGDPAKGFEVNQEDLGLYFIFYKYLRSNLVWNSDEDISLSPYICPGFWVTLMGWAGILIASPLFLVAAVFSYGWYAAVFGILGAVTPVILFAWGVIHMLRNTSYSKKFWENVMAQFGMVMLSAAFLWLLFMGKYLITLPVVAIWIFISMAHGEISPMKLPLLGKVFTALLPICAVIDMYNTKSMHVPLIEFLKFMAFEVLPLVLAFLLAVFLSLALMKRLDKWQGTDLEKKNKAKKVVGYVTLMHILILAITLYLVSVKLLPGNSVISVSLYIYATLSSLFYAGTWTKTEDSYTERAKAFFLTAYRDLESIGYGGYKKPFTSNKNLFSDEDVSPVLWSITNRERLFDFLMKSKYDHGTKILLRNVISPVALLNAVDFLETSLGKVIWYSGYVYQDMLAKGVDEEIVANTWKADGKGDFTKDEEGNLHLIENLISSKLLVKAIAASYPKPESKKETPKIFIFFGNLLEKVYDLVMALLKLVFIVLGFIPMLIYALWKSTKELCPQILKPEIHK